MHNTNKLEIYFSYKFNKKKTIYSFYSSNTCCILYGFQQNDNNMKKYVLIIYC